MKILPWKNFLYLLLTFATCLGGMSVPAAVKVKDTAIIPCYKTCNRDILWSLTTKNEKLDVLQCVQGRCTEGGSFKNRVSLSQEKMTSGDLSLIVSPVLYNDEGWYDAMCDLEFLCKFHLEVFVPTTVNASVRGNATLPCYARTQKQIADDAVKILWKKDDQTVLQVQKGNTKYGSSFTGRASVSIPHYKEGDLSLNLLRVTTSDKGLYRCYHNTEEEHGYPGAVTLNVAAHQNLFVKKFGENLTLDLFGSDGVEVTFTSHDAAETPVCSVTGNNTTCSSDNNHRISVINGFLVLRDLTSSDTGTFTVRDKMGEVIGVNIVTVEGVTHRHHYIAMSVLIGSVLICLILCRHCHRQSLAQWYRCSYNAVQSTVDIYPEPLREPACIGLSQQETNPEPDICPRTPVEETMPETERTTKKQDNTEEYIGETI